MAMNTSGEFICRSHRHLGASLYGLPFALQCASTHVVALDVFGWFLLVSYGEDFGVQYICYYRSAEIGPTPEGSSM